MKKRPPGTIAMPSGQDGRRHRRRGRRASARVALDAVRGGASRVPPSSVSTMAEAQLVTTTAVGEPAASRAARRCRPRGGDDRRHGPGDRGDDRAERRRGQDPVGAHAPRGRPVPLHRRWRRSLSARSAAERRAARTTTGAPRKERRMGGAAEAAGGEDRSGRPRRSTALLPDRTPACAGCRRRSRMFDDERLRLDGRR